MGIFQVRGDRSEVTGVRSQVSDHRSQSFTVLLVQDSKLQHLKCASSIRRTEKLKNREIETLTPDS